jgi:two-component system, OmpR family, sensor histidine kinase KdpD
VLLASYAVNWVASVVCAVASVVALNFFFVPPRWTFVVDSQANLIALFVMLLVALVISHLASALRRQTAVARRDAKRALQLQMLATALPQVTTAEAAAALGREALARAFTGRSVLVLMAENGALDLSGINEAELRDGLHCCVREVAVLGPGTGRWPGLNAWYLPLGDKSQLQGAVCIQNVMASDEAGREHAQALCSLVAQGLARIRLAESVQRAQGEVQRQQIQSTFLAAISHDLRTPLAVVVGAASALQSQRDKLSPQAQDQLISNIVSEAGYLATVTENTLELVRLNQSGHALRDDWESMQEIVGAVLARVRQRDPERRIQTRVPVDLPLLRVDAVLMAQLLTNLLDNALKYSTDTVELVVRVQGDAMQMAVKDRGPGVSAESLPTLFSPFSRGDQSSARGTGLGLALCRAIASLHGAELRYTTRQGGGAKFTVTIPLQSAPSEAPQ